MHDHVIPPPLGVSPRFIYEEQRIKDLDAAIIRYLDAGLPFPPSWVEERNERLQCLEELRKKRSD